MGSTRDWLSILIMFSAFSLKHVRASEGNSSSLNSFLHEYAFKTMPKPRTGKLYEVSLPLNLSGIKVSVLRLRTHSLWQNGADLNSIQIPPKTLPRPFTRRVDFVYQNLGNWSTSYYNVPNYTFVAPVIGFLAYDSNSVNHGLVQLSMKGDNPMVVRFDNFSMHGNGDAGMKCVRFSSNGTLEFSNVGPRSSCAATNQGHFSIVVPYQPSENTSRRVLEWWMVGIPAGILGLVLVGFLGIMLFKWRRVRNMERQSEKSEGLDTVWIGNSRMPSASGIRTLPVLENSYVP